MRTLTGISLAVYAMLYFVPPTASTQCWICYQARSNRECLIRGFARRCRPNEICENEIRYSGIQVFITKRCKQKQACSNDQYQNEQISNRRTQCGPGRKNSVCRCCCNTKNCNKNRLTCTENDEPKCRFLYLPNGLARCYGSADRRSPRTRCKFSCRKGYQVIGAKFASCQRRGNLAVWSRKIPTCRKRPTCARLLSHSFTNGFVRCFGNSGVATLGTSCVYRCNPRYSMVNNNKRKTVANYERTVCTMRRDMPTWSKRPPTCVAQMCPVATNLDHGVGRCTDSNRLGSVCTFTCFGGYELVGEERLTCVQKPGYKDWNSRLPICQPKPCPADSFNSPMLNVECSHFNKFGSICTIKCNMGYYVDELTRGGGSKSYTSTCGLQGQRVDWSLPAPKCAPKRCPPIRAPDGIVYKCTRGERYLSKCTFACPAPERVVIGQPVLTCTDDGDQSSIDGVWSDNVPRCGYKQCPQLDADATNVDCTDGFLFGSTCTFSCKKGYHMIAKDGLSVINSAKPTTTACKLSDGGVAWSNAPPRCEKQRCPEILTTDGLQVSCDRREDIGSRCSFTCLAGFQIVGKRATQCVKGPQKQILGRWITPAPECRRRPCARIIYDRSSTDMSCTNGFGFGSVCTLGCREGYFMRKEAGTPVIDRFKSTCLISKGRMEWSDTAPTCRPKKCQAMTNIDNGQMTCSGELIYGATCQFICDRGFELIGSRQVTCANDDALSASGRWSSVPPTCEPKKCPILRVNDATTLATCNDGSNYMSRCDIRCKPRHFIRDDATNINIFSLTTSCLLDQTGEMHWTPEPRNCQPVACEAIKDSAMLSACTNGNNTGSQCTFSCPIGYNMAGNATNRCLKIGEYNAAWRHPLPSCTVRRCISLVSDEDVKKTCTKNNEFNSTCSFICKPGSGLFMTRARDGKIVDSGVSKFTCEINKKNKMSWTGDLPKCHVKFCLVLRKPLNGRLRCSKRSRFGSRCTYQCNRGYRRVGNRVSECSEGKQHSPQGEWSHEPAKCRKVVGAA